MFHIWIRVVPAKVIIRGRSVSPPQSEGYTFPVSRCFTQGFSWTRPEKLLGMKVKRKRTSDACAMTLPGEV